MKKAVHKSLSSKAPGVLASLMIIAGSIILMNIPIGDWAGITRLVVVIFSTAPAVIGLLIIPLVKPGMLSTYWRPFQNGGQSSRTIAVIILLPLNNCKMNFSWPPFWNGLLFQRNSL